MRKNKYDYIFYSNRRLPKNKKLKVIAGTTTAIGYVLENLYDIYGDWHKVQDAVEGRTEEHYIFGEEEKSIVAKIIEFERKTGEIYVIGKRYEEWQKENVDSFYVPDESRVLKVRKEYRAKPGFKDVTSWAKERIQRGAF